MAKPILMDFYADWCGPCKTQNPIIDELKGKFGDKVEFKKINIDKNHELARKYGVLSIPTLIIEVENKIVQRFTGVTQANVLGDALNKILKS
ncbi:MAG: thioredoxin domain-containing protein [Methanosarcinales archaeon Met12]|nr:MAG: thioredoxin domain-containing protein [Methanosarcinales archaeon Met12]